MIYHQPYAACFLGAFFWAASNVSVAYTSQFLCPMSIVFLSYGAQIFLSLFYYTPHASDLSRGMIAQAICMAMYLILATWCFALASPTDVMAVASIQVFITPFLSKILFQTRLRKFLVLTSAMFCVSGILLLLQPSFLFDKNKLTLTNAFGLLQMACAVWILSFLFCIQRISNQNEFALAFWSYTLISILSAIPSTLCISLDQINRQSLFGVLVTALFSFLGTICNFWGWPRISPHASSMIAQSNLAFTFIISCLCGSENYDLLKLFGLSLIFGSVISYLAMIKSPVDVHYVHYILRFLRESATHEYTPIDQKI